MNWELAKGALAGLVALAFTAFAVWLWIQHEMASLGGGYFEFIPDKPRLLGIALLIFGMAFFGQCGRSLKK